MIRMIAASNSGLIISFCRAVNGLMLMATDSFLASFDRCGAIIVSPKEDNMQNNTKAITRQSLNYKWSFTSNTGARSTADFSPFPHFSSYVDKVRRLHSLFSRLSKIDYIHTSEARPSSWFRGLTIMSLKPIGGCDCLLQYFSLLLLSVLGGFPIVVDAG